MSEDSPGHAALADLVSASDALASTSARSEKTLHLAEVLRRLRGEEIPVGVGYLTGRLPQGRIGVGPALVRKVLAAEAAAETTLRLDEVDDVLGRVAAAQGPGSSASRLRLLRELFGRATPAEQSFLARLLVGELRQGAQEGVMVDAVAKAARVPAARVRRAVMFAGEPGLVAAALLRRGPDALRGFTIRPLQPVKPMLAQSADGVGEALERLERASLEYKMDGARVQVHREGDDVRIFTRRLNEVTVALPEIVESVRALPVETLILDGEALALGDGGRPRPFQVTMSRFGRVKDIEAQRRALPLSPFFFDCLYLGGEPLIDATGRERWEALASALPGGLLVPRLITSDPAEAGEFLAAARAAGHEGVMAKALDAEYVAGRRGKSWLKIKPAHTADLVVLAAEWGHGRRTGWLSNLHLGARDPEGGGFAMVGKTFKGMTDAVLEWQTARLQELETGRDGHVLHVRPELVVEIAFDGVQRSPRYPGGLALRFARLKGYREDKRAGEADTIGSLQAILEEAG